MPKKPKRLMAGGHIRVVAPAYFCHPVKVQQSVEWLEEQGFRVSLGAHVYDRYQIYAGTDEHRAEDLIAAMTDPTVDAVIAARGGYGSTRLLAILDGADLSGYWPKIFMGFSDVTALHCYWQRRYGWMTFQGPMMESDWRSGNGQAALAVLQGLDARSGPGELEPLQEGRLSPAGLLYGGNLAVLTSLVGSPYFPNLRGAILYLEDVGEAPYRIDRMLQQLQYAGLLDGVQGILFGEATQCDIPGDVYTVRRVVQSFCQSHHIPAWWGFPSGHGDILRTLPLGGRVRVRGRYCEFLEKMVE